MREQGDLGLAADQDLAELTAMLARLVGSVCTLSPQSAKTNVPPSPRSQSGTTITKNELTSAAPGAVLRICRQGRSTSPVEWQAPATMPSARPVFTSITPKYSSSRTSSAACSGVMPFSLRMSCSSPANSSSRSDFAGSTTLAPSRLRPEAAMASSSPRMTTSARPSASICSAASSVRGSEPSGSTMVRLSLRAFSLIPSINDVMRWLLPN